MSPPSAVVLTGRQVESQLVLPIWIDSLHEDPAPVLVRALAAVADAVVDAAGGDEGDVVAVKARSALRRTAARVG